MEDDAGLEVLLSKGDTDELHQHGNRNIKKRAGRTSNFWSLITGIFDLDAMSVERVHVHSLAVMKLIRPIKWAAVIT